MAIHTRYPRHSIKRPEYGDGSCWITPEGYIPLRYSGHYKALREEFNDDGIKYSLYKIAFEKGWIRVGINCENADFRFDHRFVALASLEYLYRVLSEIASFEYVKLEDDGLHYPDKRHYITDRAQIRARIKGLIKEKTALEEAFEGNRDETA